MLGESGVREVTFKVNRVGTNVVALKNARDWEHYMIAMTELIILVPITPVSEPIDEHVVDEPMSEPVDEPVSEPVNEPVSEPVDESVSEPVDEPVSELVEESEAEAVEEAVEEATEDSVEETSDYSEI